MVKQEIYDIELTFKEKILGACPKDEKTYSAFIRKRAEEKGVEVGEDEKKTLEDLEIQGWTGFHMLDGHQPILYDYVIKGFFKDACGMLKRVSGTKSSKITAHKKVIDGLVFIQPRQILISLNGGKIEILERPLRAQTPKGERVALTKSDTCPAGSKIKFKVLIFKATKEADKISREVLEEWLSYGAFRGLGQWRNASWGSFDYKIAKA